jgi:hypothetical protein
MNSKLCTVILLTTLALAFSAGCGSTSEGAPIETPPPTESLLSVSGEYDLVLTSTSGRGSTYIYTNFAQSGATLTGATSTLVCPSNDITQCVGDNFPAVSIIPTGTVTATAVTISVSFPAAAGADSVTLTGSKNSTGLGGTFSDILGDSGAWSATHAVQSANAYNMTGTYNSTSDPMPIAATILVQLAPFAGSSTNSLLEGFATIMNSPCVRALNFTGQALGDAFSLNDATAKVSILALPSNLADGTYTFNYKFDSTSPNCPGDSGSGQLTNISPWDY